MDLFRSEGFNPEMLKVARKYRGLSQSELSATSAVAQGSISKVEDGIVQPTPETCQRLVRALGFPEEFFHQQGREIGPPVSVHPMFRKRSRVTSKALEQIMAGVGLRITHLRKLMNSVDLAFEYEIPECSPDEYGGIDEVARIVRAMWYLPRGPLHDLTKFVEMSGCMVYWCDWDADIDGISMTPPGLPDCIFLNRNRPPDRMRYTLAHEVAHLVMHRVPDPTMEAEADAFASALLMPADDIRPDLMRMTIKKFGYLKQKWHVAMSALVMRAKQIGTITENQQRYFFMHMSKRGWRRREPESLDFPYEQPTALIEVFESHEEIGYTTEDICELLCISVEDFDEMYFPDRPTTLKVA